MKRLQFILSIFIALQLPVFTVSTFLRDVGIVDDFVTVTDAKDETYTVPFRTHHPNEYFGHESKLFHSQFKTLDTIFKGIRKSFDLKHFIGVPLISHHMVEMRDGVKLSTFVINPMPYHKKKGALLSRSPYGPTSDNIADIFMMMNGYAAVIQDQRGTFASEGNFSMWMQDGDDGYDTMQWISKQKWSNGEVFSAGISADGCGALTQLLNQPPWLKGQFIMLASADAHSTIYPGGAFREGLIDGWMGAMALLTGGYSLKHTLPNIMKHEALSPWYDNVEAVGKLERVNYPTVHLTSWWDIFQNEQITAWEGFSEQSHISVRNDHTIFISPLGHCFLNLPNFGKGKSDSRLRTYALSEAVGWKWAFAYAAEMFRGDKTGPAHKKFQRVNFFVQGSRLKNLPQDAGNFWVSMSDMPKTAPKRFYLSKNKALVEDKFSKVEKGQETYVYDPTKPARTIGGNNLILSMLGHGCGSMDQRETEMRSDAIVFTSPEPLSEPLAITGKVVAELYVSSDRNDTDFVVSLTDVHPTGESMQVRYGVQRMKWRYVAQESALLDSRVIYRIRIDMWFTSYVFNKGHKIRFSVTSSSNPYIKPNSNLNENVFLQTADRGMKATNTVYFSPYDYPSFVELPVVDFNDLQKSRNTQYE